MVDWELSRDPISALQEGESGPFEAFVRSHTRIFFGFFRRQGASPDRSEDLTQDVFLKLYNQVDRYREEERFSAFCFRIARNIWIDDRRRAASRRARLEVAGEGPTEVDERMGPPENASLMEEGERMRQALTQLPETHRAVFEMGVVQELGYAEIGEQLGIPVGTVKSRMYHAIRKLRQLACDDSEEGVA
jgi:RNA polymerase sigma-70 factor (ECF subfamily)